MFLSDALLDRLGRAADLPDFSRTRYRLVREIGRGGMGTVYLAEDTMLAREVALKVLTLSEPDSAERMLREARIVARLEHPGIVPVHDAGKLPDGRMYYAMKLVRGKRLDEALPAALPERLRIFVRICEAVAFAHARGVVHRDLKPANVMLGAFGEVLVLDWGVAKLLDGPEDGSRSATGAPEAGAGRTAAGTVLGTVGYMSPEQAEGRPGAVGPKSDIYSLGTILRFLLSGEPPLPDRSAGQAAAADSRNPRPLRSICARATAPAPADRYETAEELAADVERYLDGERVGAHQEGAWEKAARLFARYRTPILIVVTYLFVRALLLYFARR
jgi:serine/threonine protein kinase